MVLSGWVPGIMVADGEPVARAVVLQRYNTVLDELFAGDDVCVITPV